MFSFQFAIKIFFYFGYEVHFLFLINFHNGVQNLEVVIDFAGRLHECLHVFRETAAAIPDAREQESFPDAFITADPSPHHIHICPQSFAELGNFIHKSYLGCQE